MMRWLRGLRHSHKGDAREDLMHLFEANASDSSTVTPSNGKD